MLVEVWLDRLNQGINLEAESTYQKGDLFCVKCLDKTVRKYPIDHIFCVKETEYLQSHENKAGKA